MALRYNKKLVIIMIMLILFSCTICGVKQNTDKQEVKKKIVAVVIIMFIFSIIILGVGSKLVFQKICERREIPR